MLRTCGTVILQWFSCALKKRNHVTLQVYALLHRQEVFAPFRSQQRFADLMENIFLVLDHFNAKVCSHKRARTECKAALCFQLQPPRVLTAATPRTASIIEGCNWWASSLQLPSWRRRVQYARCRWRRRGRTRSSSGAWRACCTSSAAPRARSAGASACAPSRTSGGMQLLRSCSSLPIASWAPPIALPQSSWAPALMCGFPAHLSAVHKRVT